MTSGFGSPEDFSGSEIDLVSAFLAGGSAAAGLCWRKPVAPAATAARSTSTAAIILSLPRNMAFSAPSVRAAALAEIMPGTAAFPTANRHAALIVFDTTESGRPADAFPAGQAAVTSTAAGP